MRWERQAGVRVCGTLESTTKAWDFISSVKGEASGRLCARLSMVLCFILVTGFKEIEGKETN